MIETFFIYLVLALISFFPIVIWAYIFSYIDNNPLNKKRFFIGVLAGALSVVPILYMDRFLQVFDFEYINIFYFASQVSDFLSSIKLSLSLSLFLLFLVACSFVLGGFVHKFRQVMQVYIKNIFVFLVFIFFLGLFVYLFHLVFHRIDFHLGSDIRFGDIIFHSFQLVVFYYLLVAFIEEASKHFNFLQTSVLHIDSIKVGVLYSIFVALGFSLVENMLYLYNYYIQYSLGRELLQLYFFRSAFSVIVHVLSSSIVAYYFSRALLLYRGKDLSFPYLKIFLFGLVVSIFLHLLFDVALTLGFTFVIFIYFIGGYLYVSSIFYRE